MKRHKKKTQTELRRRKTRPLHVEQLETRAMLSANFLHNDAVPLDVNADLFVSPVDALAVINQLNQRAIGPESGDGGPRASQFFLDVNNDSALSAVDALLVINSLNDHLAPPMPLAAKTPPAPTTTPTPPTTRDPYEQHGEHEGQFGPQNEAGDRTEVGETKDDVPVISPASPAVAKTLPPANAAPTTPTIPDPYEQHGEHEGQFGPRSEVGDRTEVGETKDDVPVTPPAAPAGAKTIPSPAKPTVGQSDTDDQWEDGTLEPGEMELVALLNGPAKAGQTTAKGVITFEHGRENGRPKDELYLAVTGVDANATLDILVNDTLIGQLTTNASGYGQLALVSGTPDTGELPLPASYPVVDAGVIVKVGATLQGTFAHHAW